MQLNLFASETRAPPPSKYRIPLEKHGVSNPWGKADRKGNIFWEKMHKTLEGMTVHDREVFNYITIILTPERLDGFEKALRMFNKASEYDRIDFDESRGRL